jgi:hypothetical protein
MGNVYLIVGSFEPIIMFLMNAFRNAFCSTIGDETSNDLRSATYSCTFSMSGASTSLD